VAVESRQFEIHKSLYTFLVSVQGMRVVVKPLRSNQYIEASPTVAITLQELGNSALLISHPPDPFLFLESYYQLKGWTVSGAE
jgi:hypothetical protein